MSSLRKALLSLLTVSMVAIGNQSALAMPSQEPTQVAGDPTSMTSGFYVDPNSNPATWVRQNPGHADATLIRTQIAEKAGGRWFGNWSGDITAATRSFTTAADSADKLPILIAYNIPGRDCGSHSGGGAGSPEAYRTWISRFADGIGTRPAVVIIEPDALAQLDCVPAAEKQTRLDLLKYAVNQFASKNPNTWAYMDGGNATWIEAGEMARRLKLVEVGKIRGFALNTSNYYTTAQSVTKGNAIRGAVGGGQFVIDTSRNGNGSNGEWCNPAGRKLGDTSRNGNHVSGTVDMLLWLKVPGDSDGSCGIGTGIPAGTFSPVLAKRLITGS
ncbi:glycoside hydrolase family 6 protein [Kribbella sp. NPDC023855]|uniref:glycoside hydrolase family 6 protein n=1 Tax=Kribbella sp. NPDC023855 TaxID=3154698 RepID=UPI0033E18691